ncbi:MAG: SURF1 family protein [Ilumatobacteraceae bacterium]
MHSFLLRPKWILFHLLAVAGIIGMLSASHWQWTKYNARNAFVEQVGVRQDTKRTPPVALTTLLDQPVADIEYRIATAVGSYIADGQLTQILRTQEGVNGVYVLTPFQIDNGPIVLVNRGFVPDRTEAPPPPDGRLTIGGSIEASQQRRTGELTDNAAGESSDVRRIDLPLIETEIGLQLAPVYLDFIASQPPATQPPAPVPPPDVSGDTPYLSYTVQWLVFSTAVAVGWVLAVRRSIRTNRKRRADEAAATNADLISVDAEAGGEPPSRPSA